MQKPFLKRQAQAPLWNDVRGIMTDPLTSLAYLYTRRRSLFRHLSPAGHFLALRPDLLMMGGFLGRTNFRLRVQLRNCRRRPNTHQFPDRVHGHAGRHCLQRQLLLVFHTLTLGYRPLMARRFPWRGPPQLRLGIRTARLRHRRKP